MSAKKPKVYKKKPSGVNNTGKPPAVIDLDLVEKFSRCHPSDTELAALLGISHPTFVKHKKLNPEILEAMAKGQAYGRGSLRGKQFDMAMKGNVPMLVWLGKQLLQQREKILHGTDAENPAPENTENLTREQLIAEIKERSQRLGIAGVVE